MATKPHQRVRECSLQVADLENITECLDIKVSSALLCGFSACGNSVFE